MTPSISVIFPVYNCEAYVEAAMASVLSQEVDLEIVAVDDGSTDQTGFLLDTIAKKEPRLRVFHQKNSGVAAARNYAIAQAKGQWIAFCDGDDTVPPNAYRRFLEKSDVDDIDVIVGDYRNASDTSGQSTGAYSVPNAVPCSVSVDEADSSQLSGEASHYL